MDCVRENYLKRRTKTIAELQARYRADPETYRLKERERAQRDPKWYWTKSAIKNAKIRAEEAGVPCTITRMYLVGIVPDVCPVFDTPFVFVGGGKVRMESATLDRINPALGYVEGNVAVISQKANTIKSNATSAEVARVAAWMKEQGV